MIATDISTVQVQQAHNNDKKEVLRADLEATRVKFHMLLDSISEDTWHQKSPTTNWSVAEVFVHLTWAIEFLPKEVASARKGKGMFNMPGWISDPASYWYIRFAARKSTRASIRKRYDAAINATINALATVADTDWQLGAQFYGEGYYSVEDLFKTPGQHLTDHRAGL